MDESGETRRGGRYSRGSSYRYAPRGDHVKEKYEKQGDDLVVLTNRVYVTNLSYHTTWQNLKDHMRSAGEVVYADVFSDDKGRSKGCGIVEFQTAEEALTAINTLNDSILDGRDIYIREDKEDKNIKKYATEAVSPIVLKVNRSTLSNKSSNSYSNNYTNSYSNSYTKKSSDYNDRKGRQIFIKNLPYSSSWQELRDTFNECGNIIRTDILVGPDGRSNGQGTILFESIDDAQKAIDTFNDTEFMGRVISVHEDKFA